MAIEKINYSIEVIPQSGYTYHVTINGLHAGIGGRRVGNALADELRASDEKAKLVYDLAIEDCHIG